MATNDFKAFATGAGANALSQAEYEALTGVIANGFGSGVARSAQLNKVWRQGTVMASVIGAYIASHGLDALDDGDTEALLEQFASALLSGGYAVDSGVANAYVAALTTPPSEYVAGLCISLKVSTTNSGPSTLTVSGLGEKVIKTTDGSDVIAGELLAGSVVTLVYDGTYFILTGVQTVAPTQSAGNSSTKIASTAFVSEAIQSGQLCYGVDTGTANSYAVTLSPTPANISSGFSVAVKITHANTGASTLNIGLGAKPIINKNGSALVSGQLIVGAVVIFQYDGSNFQSQLDSPASQTLLSSGAAAPTLYGYRIEPVGTDGKRKIEQYAQVTTDSTGSATWNYPIVFPGTAPVVFLTAWSSGAGPSQRIPNHQIPGLSAVTVNTSDSTGTPVATTVSCKAEGY